MSQTLTAGQLTLLEAALVQRKQVLQDELRSQLGEQDRVGHAREQLLQGLDDEREHDADREVDLARTDQTLDALSQVDAALLRLHGKDYGKCSDCGGEIPFERLQHSPEVTRCITCQTKLEKSSGTPRRHKI